MIEDRIVDAVEAQEQRKREDRQKRRMPSKGIGHDSAPSSF
jgi:hypothetical protein